MHVFKTRTTRASSMMDVIQLPAAAKDNYLATAPRRVVIVLDLQSRWLDGSRRPLHARHGLVVNGDVIYAWSAAPACLAPRSIRSAVIVAITFDAPRCVAYSACHARLRSTGRRLRPCTEHSSSRSSRTDGSHRSISEARWTQMTLRAVCMCHSDAIVALCLQENHDICSHICCRSSQRSNHFNIPKYFTARSFHTSWYAHSLLNSRYELQI